MGKDERTLTVKAPVGLIWKEFVALKYRSPVTHKAGTEKSDLLMSNSDFYNKQL